jgi:hypothetical protein
MTEFEGLQAVTHEPRCQWIWSQTGEQCSRPGSWRLDPYLLEVDEVHESVALCDQHYDERKEDV